MKKSIILISTALSFVLYISSCHSTDASNKNPASSDSLAIASGAESFNLNCSGCHNFSQSGIGPSLAGLATKVPRDWIERFIKDPQKMISSHDERAERLYKQYKSIMPSFAGLKEDEIKNIIAFINNHKEAGKQKENKNALLNPIPESIQSSSLVVGLQMITQIPASSDSGKKPLARITKMDVQPSTQNLFVLDLRGKLYRLQNGRPVVYMDMAKLRPKFIHEPGLATGFGSFAFHPDFLKNGILYTTHTEPPGSGKADFGYADSIKVALQWVLTEWKSNDPRATEFSGTSRELLRINMVSSIHGVQEISFNPFSGKGKNDYGLLYIGIGDGGCVENGYAFLAHSKEKIWGTILRIDPSGRNSGNGQYGIPGNNPFSHDPDKNVLKEIFAYGFRNPHRFTWTRSNKMLACNIGHSNIESIDLVTGGHDYGWPIREGNFLLDPYGDLTTVSPLPPDDSSYKITYPIAEYDHDEGKAISGGFEYLGSIPGLKGKYFFGDIPTGRLFYIDLADVKQGQQAKISEWKISIDGNVKTLKEICGSDRVDLHFGRDSKGGLYILTKADGKIYKLVSVQRN